MVSYIKNLSLRGSDSDRGNLIDFDGRHVASAFRKDKNKIAAVAVAPSQ
jgi:hypothetical protein